ncbi:Testis-specific Y-encoded protein 10 [Vulpes lagopus]
MLRFMTNLKVWLAQGAEEEVQDVTFPSACRRILLFFGKNSYFQNYVLVKEYVVSAAGYRATHSTPIQWSQSYEREAYRRQHQDNGLNFFNWFSGHHLAGSGRIAEVGPCDRLDHHGRPVAQCPQVLREGSHRRTGGASRCRDECEETAHLSTAIADVQMDTSGQHGSPA